MEIFKPDLGTNARFFRISRQYRVRLNDHQATFVSADISGFS
jgi:hypothetical protein